LTPTPIPTPTPSPTPTPIPTGPVIPIVVGATESASSFDFLNSSGTTLPTFSPSSSVTLTLPFGTASGQLLLATVGVQGASAPFANILIPAGWTELRHDSCGNNLQLSVAYRIAQA